MSCNCRKAHNMAPAPKPKDMSKVQVPKKEETPKEEKKEE